MPTNIPVFIDGDASLHYSESLNRLFAGNYNGLVKVFNPDDLDSEPVSFDVDENVTSLSSFGSKLLVANMEGYLSAMPLNDNFSCDDKGSPILEVEYPLRCAELVNDGKRIVCGGDETELILIDVQSNQPATWTIADKLVGIAYNPIGELVALALANGEVHVFSVLNEKPELVHKITNALPTKVHTSTESIDYKDEHAHELVCTRPLWSADGESILIPTAMGSVKSFARSDWRSNGESAPVSSTLVAVTCSPSHKFVALLFKNGSVNIHSLKTLKLIRTLDTGSADVLPLSMVWVKKTIFVGINNGSIVPLQVLLEDEEDEAPAIGNPLSDVDKLFLEEASESETETAALVENTRKRDALDDSRIIDEDDEEEEADDAYKYYNRGVEDIMADRRKRARFQPPVPAPVAAAPVQQIIPYSPGSTPWIKSVNSGSSSTKRRYLFMNAIGYAWSVKDASHESAEAQKSVTISFFDRSVNKDYHFIDYYHYDLCSMNERGILLGCSGFEPDSDSHKGRIFYRHHVNTSDSWSRQIPLMNKEYISSVCITSSTTDGAGDSIIAVGTNFGYVRFFNLFGLCINIMKVSPVVSLVSSAINTVFSIHSTGIDSYSYSIINVPEDYKYYQQECHLPIKASRGPLIKGLFFNDRSDPCLVAGHDETLLVLSHWREPGNARWVPVLNHQDAVSDFGVSETKKNWKCWPLGLQEDRSVCLILKNNDAYPGFPLPLPIELDLRLPTKCFKSLLAKSSTEDDEDEIADGQDETERKLQKLKEDDPEEQFLRVSTLGKLLLATLEDQGEDDEQMEVLKEYMLVFDKSLLKLFNNACQESRLNKAFSISRLIKNDKALLAATKIAERHGFSNLMAKINRLREDLMEDSDEEED